MRDCTPCSSLPCIAPSLSIIAYFFLASYTEPFLIVFFLIRKDVTCAYSIWPRVAWTRASGQRGVGTLFLLIRLYSFLRALSLYLFEARSYISLCVCVPHFSPLLFSHGSWCLYGHLPQISPGKAYFSSPPCHICPKQQPGIPSTIIDGLNLPHR